MPFAEMSRRLAASRLGVEAVWISKDGGPSVTIRVIPARPEAAFDSGGARAKAIASSCRIAMDALPGGPAVANDLLAFEDQGYIIKSTEQDERAGSYIAHLRRQ